MHEIHTQLLDHHDFWLLNMINLKILRDEADKKQQRPHLPHAFKQSSN